MTHPSSQCWPPGTAGPARRGNSTQFPVRKKKNPNLGVFLLREPSVCCLLHMKAVQPLKQRWDLCLIAAIFPFVVFPINLPAMEQGDWEMSHSKGLGVMFPIRSGCSPGMSAMSLSNQGRVIPQGPFQPGIHRSRGTCLLPSFSFKGASERERTC